MCKKLRPNTEINLLIDVLNICDMITWLDCYKTHSAYITLNKQKLYLISWAYLL
jgi:hypothetical protein